MSRTIFVTGFPGFIAQNLAGRLAEGNDDRLVFLVQTEFESLAKTTLSSLGLADRASIVIGDITQPKLGTDDDTYVGLITETTHVWHLAAIYDLAVPEAIAYRVNVVGTANVLDFCEACQRFARLDYISTCYVSGLRTGLIMEDELDEGQGFKNHYESTKCRAEMEVSRRMDRLPVVIHRPGIVVGDSRTGRTAKFDGPYYLIRLLCRLPSWVPMVHVGAGNARPNFVPVDFLISAMVALANNDEAIGNAVQLADPNPHPARDIIDAVVSILGRTRAIATVPPGLVDRLIKIGPVAELVQIPREALIYFNHDVIYDTTHAARLLEGTGVECPDLMSYLPILVAYARDNPS